MRGYVTTILRWNKLVLVNVADEPALMSNFKMTVALKIS